MESKQVVDDVHKENHNILNIVLLFFWKGNNILLLEVA